MRLSIYGVLFLFLTINFSGCGNSEKPIPREIERIEFGQEKVFVPPTLSGQYPVGTREFHWIDQVRGEPHTNDDSDRREVLVRVFYPTDRETPENRLPVLDINRWDGWFSGYGNLGNKRLRRANYTDSYWPVYQDGDISSQEGFFPLVIFSHGYGFSPEEHVYLTADLASRGYIVASINHPYGSSRALFPDGRVVLPVGLPSNNLGKDLELWAEDQVFVIEQMFQQNSEVDSFLYSKIDQAKIITTGHSYGGAASFHSAWLDNRVKLAVDIDGTIFNLADRRIGIPFMFIQSGNGDSFEVFEHVLNDGYNVAFEQRINHHGFADYVMYWQSDFPGIDQFGSLNAEVGILTSVDILEQFIEKYLEQSAAPLLDEPEHHSPYTKVRSFND